MGRGAFTNGALMKEADFRFDLLVTLDQNLRFQNPAGKHTLGILVLITPFNHLAAYRPQFAEIRDVARQTKPGQVNVAQIR